MYNKIGKIVELIDDFLVKYGKYLTEEETTDYEFAKNHFANLVNGYEYEDLFTCDDVGFSPYQTNASPLPIVSWVRNLRRSVNTILAELQIEFLQNCSSEIAMRIVQENPDMEWDFPEIYSLLKERMTV